MPKFSADLNWKGGRVFDNLIDASRAGIDETMAAAVKDAKENVPVVYSVLQGSITLRPAGVQGKVISGIWGSFDVNYALAVETGNRSLVGDATLDQTRETTAGSRRGRNTGNKHFLRGGAEKEYGKLGKRIARRYKGK